MKENRILVLRICKVVESSKTISVKLEIKQKGKQKGEDKTTDVWAPDGSAGKESACNAGDTEDGGLIPGSGRSPGGGNSNPF